MGYKNSVYVNSKYTFSLREENKTTNVSINFCAVCILAHNVGRHMISGVFCSIRLLPYYNLSLRRLQNDL